MDESIYFKEKYILFYYFLLKLMNFLILIWYERIKLYYSLLPLNEIIESFLILFCIFTFFHIRFALRVPSKFWHIMNKVLNSCKSSLIFYDSNEAQILIDFLIKTKTARTTKLNLQCVSRIWVNKARNIIFCNFWSEYHQL